MSSSKVNLKFKRLKDYDTIWHPESSLVLKSATDKIVIGRFEDGKMVNFDEKTLELCKEWKFKYDESLLVSDDGNAEEQNESDNIEEQTLDGQMVADEQNDAEEQNDDEEEEEEEEEEEDDDEDEEDKNDDEEEKQNVTKTEIPGDDEQNIDDFSSKFNFVNKYLNDLSTSINSQNKKSEKEIESLKDKLSLKNKEYDQLKNDYNKMEEQYVSLKTKFEGIKNFFS